MAAISVLIPHNYLSAYLGRGVLPMLAMMLVGIPMYVCSTASVPIAAAFMAPALIQRLGKKHAHIACGCDGIPCATDQLTSDPPAPTHAASCGCGSRDADPQHNARASESCSRGQH